MTKLEAVARFALSMKTCLASGLPARKALELSGATVPSAALRRAVRVAVAMCDRGLPISDGLEASHERLPSFFIPVLRAGEMSGRQVEAFQLIYEHSQRLKPSLTAVRNTWLYPLVCMASGWIIRLGIFIYFGIYHLAWQFFRDTFINVSVIVLGGRLLLQIPLLKQAADYLLLQLPFLRESLIRVSVVLFFATFRLAYGAGGMAVTSVFDVALATVSNSAIRKDLASARPILESHGGIEDAFNEPTILNATIKSSIATGALSGRLDSSLDQIVRSETDDLEVALDKFNRIYLRLVGYSVAMSIAGTFLLCLYYK